MDRGIGLNLTIGCVSIPDKQMDMIENTHRPRLVRVGYSGLSLVLFFILFAGSSLMAQKQGLKLTITSRNTDQKDVRRARMVALYVAEDQSVSPFLPAGPFQATWKGALTFDGFGIDATFSARGTGHVKAKVNNTVVLDSDLEPGTRVTGKSTLVQNGPNPLHVQYTAPDEGPARLRLYWQSKKFPHEPLPITQLQHQTDDRNETYRLRRRGRTLFARYRCLRCHTAPDGASLNMPELNKDAPDLANAGHQFRKDWLVQWIKNPHSVRNETTMPAVLHGSSKKKQRIARDLAAYLAERRTSSSFSELNVTDQKVQQGKHHFRAYGCVACHRLSEDQAVDDPVVNRISLAHVGKKWKPGALVSFLKNPHKQYRWRRMPDFDLTTEEASTLAGFLLKTTGEPHKPDPDDRESGNADRGRKWMKTTGCNQCHAPEQESSNTGPPLSKLLETQKDQLDAGCLAPGSKKRNRSPNFDFSKRQRTALRTFLSGKAKASLSRYVPAEFAARQFKNLRCRNCHQRDSNYSTWANLPETQTSVELDHEKTWGVKQNRPPLTWVGEQLRYDWMKKRITGTLKEKSRPWLIARMPGFGVYGKPMARGLAAQHGFPPEPVDTSEPDPELGRAGKKIVKRLNCYSCHGAGDKKPTTFEVAGINFFKSARRLRREYTIRWLLNPERIRPDTQMTAFFQWGKASPLGQILDGDLNKQMKALWQYLKQVEKLEK